MGKQTLPNYFFVELDQKRLFNVNTHLTSLKMIEIDRVPEFQLSFEMLYVKADPANIYHIFWS